MTHAQMMGSEPTDEEHEQMLEDLLGGLDAADVDELGELAEEATEGE